MLDDDGVDRGIVFLFMGTDLARQFEFIKSQWADDGQFTGLGAEKDPVVGDNDGTGVYTIPRRPVRRRLPQVPRFSVTTGGEYFFMPGIRALQWMPPSATPTAEGVPRSRLPTEEHPCPITWRATGPCRTRSST